jgi:predicted aspartyl protease
MEKNTSDNCIACHTAIAVSINWTRPAAIGIDTTSDGYNITINGTRTAYGVRIETFGNGSGDAIAVSNVTVI